MQTVLHRQCHTLLKRREMPHNGHLTLRDSICTVHDRWQNRQFELRSGKLPD